MDLKNIDLNLLVVFNEVVIERRVSKVAENLGLSQPAVSNALARLRKLLGDELLVPTPRGMQPTPFADHLVEPVAQALNMLHVAINRSNYFDPATSQRVFRIAVNDIGEVYFLTQLMEELQQIAPGVSVATGRSGDVNLRSEMESGHLDLALGLLPGLKAGFFQRRLFQQRYVCMFRAGRMPNKSGFGLKEFSEADHVGIVSPGTGHGVVDELLERQGIKRKIRLQVQNFIAVGHVLQGTDMVATVPEGFAERMAKPFGLTYVAHPVELPLIAIKLFWHAKQHKDPANQWLRSLMFKIYSESGSAA